MAQEMNYRDFRIVAESYQNEQGKWVPQAFVTAAAVEKQFSQQGHQGPLAWPREFESQFDADNFALESAQFYVDTTYY